jgi:signal transduction histidine kinase
VILGFRLPKLGRVNSRPSAFSRIFRGRRRERLVRNYFFISVILIAGGLISAGALEIYFRYRESLEQVQLAQQDNATDAALQIERFMQDLATIMKAFTKNAVSSFPVMFDDYEFELRRLLFLAPAITEVLIMDADGVVQSQASRFRAVAPLLKKDLSQAEAFRQSSEGRTYYGTVYFRDSDPYVTVAVPVEQVPGEIVGVLQAESSLRDILDAASGVRFGGVGYRYVVTRSGDLIAHSNFRLVLQRRDVRGLTQVKAVFQAGSDAVRPRAVVAHNTEGQKVFSSHAFIPTLDWAVFIERPTSEVYGPIYASMLRTSALLLIGLGVALLATLLVRHRVVRPLETLREGVERIRMGDLTTRLNLKTGDELEVLAEEFNGMAAHLKEAYSELEHKVADRTQALMIANEQLAEASKLKSQFLANANHELRTPLSAIMSYAGLVMSDSGSQISPLQKENLQDLLNNAERLLSLIDSLLDIARIEAGKLELRIEPIEIGEIVQSATSTIESTLSSDRIRVVRDIAPNLPVLNSDRDKLRRIVLNLLDNAVKFTERGEIKISASRQDGALKLMVSDTGIGISQSDINQIFEEFHRGTAGAGKYRGTGLGLAIVKRLVGLLGGHIEVSSEVSIGSTFTVTLPFEYQARAAA